MRALFPVGCASVEHSRPKSMSIAKIISDAFREDKFGHEFISHNEERLQAMNDAQLAGVERFLLPMIANSKITYIRDAFKELEGKTR